MKNILFVLAFFSLFSGQLSAQLGPISITSMPCSCNIGGSGVITVSAAPGATYYQWQSMIGHVNAIWFNGSPGPVQTPVNNVNIDCQLAQQFYVICVTAYNATDSSNTACDTIWGFIAAPVLSSTNNSIAIPGDSGVYTVDVPAAGCPASYLWTITGDAAFNNGTQTTSGSGTGVNINFGPNFTSGILCVQAFSQFGIPTDTVCMVINAPSGIIDNTHPVVSIYHQPSLNQITLGFSTTINELVSIQLYDITGRLITLQQANIGASQQPVLISMSNLNKGVYLVTVQGTFFRKTLKFAKTY